MDNFVINLGRELGSGGREVGRRVAEALGIEFYDRSIVECAAKSSGLSKECIANADEQPRSSFLSTLVNILRGPIATTDSTVVDVLGSDNIYSIQSAAIEELAAKGSALFVGRCADYVLRDHPRSVSVFVCADLEERIDRVMEYNSLESRDKALSLINRVDEQRADFYNFYSSKVWGAAASYDLTINVSKLGLEASVELILCYIEQRLGVKRIKL